MNAKELHDLYAPLWAAVPETRPAWMRYELYSYGKAQSPVFTYGMPLPASAGGRNGVPLPAEAAAAMCRVAAEDFLIASRRNFCVSWRDGWFTIWLADDEPGRTPFDGTTIHAALVAACLAVHASSSPTSAPSPQLPHPPA